MSAYAELLRDPRWQKRRLEIMERDKWACRRCGSAHKTLNVHHVCYLRNSDPWDYPDRLLITFCEECHQLEETEQQAASVRFAGAFRYGGATNSDLDRIALLIEELIRFGRYTSTIPALELAIQKQWDKRVGKSKRAG